MHDGNRCKHPFPVSGRFVPLSAELGTSGDSSVLGSHQNHPSTQVPGNQNPITSAKAKLKFKMPSRLRKRSYLKDAKLGVLQIARAISTKYIASCLLAPRTI